MQSQAQARRNMVDCQLRTFDVTDRAVLAAMDEIEREHFLPPELAGLAYADRLLTLPGEEGGARTLLPPMVLARLVQALAVEADERALDVAGGGGYSACILARLGASVVALDTGSARGEFTRRAVAAAGCAGRVEIRSGALVEGCAELGPFDVILVNGSVDGRPEALLGQLKDGGRLACLHPEGGVGRAVLYMRSGRAFGSRSLFDAVAPPLAEFLTPAEFRF